jgi:CubicO group peptidase (beta-lactamase class C family)
MPLRTSAASDPFANVAEEMIWAGVPGASLAYIDAAVIVTQGFGTRNKAARQPVTDKTIFEAASVSKPVYTFAVMSLVREGKLDLRRPLDDYLDKPYPIADPRGTKITAHHVMTHTSGLPNWRPHDSEALTLAFDPGTRYQYSGEGYYFLQTVVEQISGLGTGAFMRRALDGLGMKHSSYVWLDSYAADCAAPYGNQGQALRPDTRIMGEQLVAAGKARGRPFADWKTAEVLAKLPSLTPPWQPVPHNAMPNAAWSLLTTAGDLAAFVATLLRSPSDPMLVPQIKMQAGIYRGLGIELQIDGVRRGFFHTGSNPGFKTVIFGDLATKRGVVTMSNSTNGFVFEMHVIDDTLGEQPAVFYLEEP